MLSYIIRRLLLMGPTLLGISMLTFCLMALSPGGMTAVITNQFGGLDSRARQAQTLYYTKKYGLDKPLPIQYLKWLNLVSPVGFKYPGEGWPADWSVGFKTPDLGQSIIVHRPVLDLIEESLPRTLLLNGLSIPLITVLSIWMGIVSARHRGGLVDVGGGSVSLGLWSVPQIWAGVLLIGYLANKDFLKWFPTVGLHDLHAEEMSFLPTFADGFQRGWLLDTAWHLVLPVICLSYAEFAFTSKIARSAVLENLQADFVRTARAKGLNERDVLYKHVFRNSLLPIITTLGMQLPLLISGSIIVEYLFGIPGMGKLTVDSVFNKDPQMVLSLTLVVAILMVFSYLLTDIFYAIADPRVSYAARGS